MTQLSAHFTLEEFTRSAAAAALVPPDDNAPTPAHLANLKITAQAMEHVRDLLGHPIHVSSGYRNPRVNKAVGGVPNSDHALGWACDFECPAFGTPYDTTAFLAAHLTDFDQLIHEKKPGSWWTHLSVNPRRRRQLLTLVGPGQYEPGIHPRP